jgi:hypothetical protein
MYEKEVQHHSLTSALDRDGWSVSRYSSFIPRKTALKTLNKRLGGPQRKAENFREKKNLLVLLQIEPQFLH